MLLLFMIRGYDEMEDKSVNNDMITVTFKNGIKHRYKKGTSYYDISKDNHDVVEIIGVKVNNELFSLTDKVSHDVNVEFIDVTDVSGYKMYQAGLKFLLEVAVKETIPNSEVYFKHSVPKGVLAEVKCDRTLLEKEFLDIKSKMRDLVREDHRIYKYNVYKKEAVSYYEEQGYYEKAKNIHNLNSNVVAFYKLKDLFNYFYVEMPYSTAALRRFDLEFLGDNRFVIVIPSVRTNGRVPEYINYPNIIDSFYSGAKWLEQMKMPYVSDINDLVANGGIKDFILASEIVYNNSISKLADKVVNNRNIKFVLIAGPSSSGKTTTTKRLSTYFTAKGFDPICLSTDDYYLDIDKIPLNKDGEKDFEALEALDLEEFNSDLKKLLIGESIDNKKYDFVLGKRFLSGTKTVLKENGIVLIEGLHCLNEELSKQISSDNKYKVYLSPFIPLNIDRHNYISTVDLRLLRRIARDNRSRGKGVCDTIEMWQQVRNGEEKYIFPYISQANVVLNTAMAYELGVLKVFVNPLLYSVEANSPYYEEARRLINFLSSFYEIPSELIHNFSVIREFIGGGIVE